LAKDFTALGGKVSGTGPRVKTEKGEGVEIGDDAVKLFTFGRGEVDKDAVLQAAKTQIDGIKPACQQIVLEILDILRGLVAGGVEPPGLGLVQKIIDKLN
jgi:hypothetical protein